MDWNETRKKLLHLGSSRHQDRGAAEAPQGPPVALRPREDGELEPLAPTSPRAASLCIASGKGGTGKTVTTASLARLFAREGRTLIVDADLGVGNAHILQDVSPERTFVDLVEGDVPVSEVVAACCEGLDLVGAGSGVPRMADLSSYELHLVASGLEELEADYRFLVVDSAAGVSRQTMAFAEACDVTLVVTTPDLTAMTDAYAFLKVHLGRKNARPLLLVNRARDEEQAIEVTERILGVCERFLGTAPVPIGWVPEDPLVGECVNRRSAVIEGAPRSAASQALRARAQRVLEELTRERPGGIGRRLVEKAGYARRLA